MAGAGGWWLALSFDHPTKMRNVIITWEKEPASGVQVRHSKDAKNWQSYTHSVTNKAVDINYLWIVIPNQGIGRVPAIREINIE